MRPIRPTNITLLDPKTIVPGVFKQVTSTDSFEGMTQNLNEDGLYSIEIFGKLGSKERDQTEAYIDTKLLIFNPTFLRALLQLKGLYQGILRGSEYAVWDNDEQDFIKSNILEGETGFSFFVKHLTSIKPAKTDSYKRKQRIELFERFKHIALTSKIIVTPAGIRDIQFEPNGAPTEQEINELYRKLIFRTRVVSISKPEDGENTLYDTVRSGLQNSFNDIDDYIFNLSEGKGGVFQRRMSTRGVVSGTRNVITARKVSRANLFEDDNVNPNTVDMGFYQALLNFQYNCIHAVLTTYLQNIFTQGSQTAKLVNTKSLEFEYVELHPNVIEKWNTATGLSKLFNGFSNVNIRTKEILLSGHYLALIYDDGTDVCVFNDINDLPQGKSRKFVKPINYLELFYLSCFETIADQISQQTRYPITGIGSIFPSIPNVKTIIGAKPRTVRNIDWEETGRCLNFPHRTENPDYFDAMSVDPSREDGLGSDHDGDALNSNSVSAEDSKAQVRELFGKREYYIGGAGNFLYDPVNEPILFMLAAGTSDVEE